jgi:hypothetical protein
VINNKTYKSVLPGFSNMPSPELYPVRRNDLLRIFLPDIIILQTVNYRLSLFFK